MLLRCANPGSESRPTLLVDSREIAWKERERREFERIVWRVRNGRGSFLASAVFKNGLGLRYDADCMLVAAQGFGPPAARFVESLAGLVPIAIEWDSRLALIVDNWRMLHGRASASGADAGIRRLERVLVTEDDR